MANDEHWRGRDKPNIRHIYGPYRDRVPTEVDEPHESIAFDVKIGVVINMAFEGPVSEREWDEAVQQNVAEAVRDPNRWDALEWSVLYVEEAE